MGESFVLCPTCGLPETRYSIKNGTIWHKCAACGAKEMVDMNHKVTNYILAEDKKEKKKKKPKEITKEEKKGKGKDDSDEDKKKKKRKRRRKRRRKKAKKTRKNHLVKIMTKTRHISRKPCLAKKIMTTLMQISRTTTVMNPKKLLLTMKVLCCLLLKDLASFLRIIPMLPSMILLKW